MPAATGFRWVWKQLQAEPWDAVPEKYLVGQRVTGTVTRLMDFGAFVELEPGIEGLIHVSEMSWVKKVRKPSDKVVEGPVTRLMNFGAFVQMPRGSRGLSTSAEIVEIAMPPKLGDRPSKLEETSCAQHDRIHHKTRRRPWPYPGAGPYRRDCGRAADAIYAGRVPGLFGEGEVVVERVDEEEGQARYVFDLQPAISHTD